MEDMTWTVVQFLEDLSVEAIPTSWIDGAYCHWPPYKQEKLTAAIKKCKELNTHWPSHAIKIFRNATFDDYGKARQKARVAEDCSDLNSESDSNGKRKRIRKVVSSSSVESDNERESRKLLPPPPKLPHVKSQLKAINLPSSHSIGSNVPFNSSGNSYCPTKSIKSFDHGMEAPKEAPISTSETNIQQKVSNTAVTLGATEHQNDTKQTCCIHDKQILLEIKDQNHMIRGILVDVLNDIKQLKNVKSETLKTSIFVKYPNIKFPIGTEDEFNLFEVELENEEHFVEAVNELAKFGGSNPYNFVKRTMSAVLKDTVISHYSWLGRKGKKSLNKTVFSKVLLQAAENCLNCDKRQIEVAIQSFMKRSGERLKTKADL